MAGTGGFSLIEVTIALGLIAFALMATFGLLVAGQKSDTDSVRRLGAAHSASQLLVQRRTTPASVPVPPTNTILPAIQSDSRDILAGEVYLDESNAKQSEAKDALYRVNYQIQTAPEGEVAILNLRYSWPAASSTQSREGSFEITTGILVK